MRGFGLEGRSVLVTGAGSGIGRAIAVAFAEEGAKVTIADRDDAGARATLEAIQQANGQGCCATVDVREPKQADQMVAAAVQAWGRLDSAVNAAGVGSPVATDVTGCTDDHWSAVLAVNLTGVFNCMRAEVAQMLGQGGGGAIVNIASVGGLVGTPRAPAYIASKHGVVGLTRASALDHAAQRVRINAICPGYIAGTAMMDGFMAKRPDDAALLAAAQPMGRMGRTGEIADTALWLCSERSGFVTGATIAVDGGLTAQ